jgi:hypothetical protein
VAWLPPWESLGGVRLFSLDLTDRWVQFCQTVVAPYSFSVASVHVSHLRDPSPSRARAHLAARSDAPARRRPPPIQRDAVGASCLPLRLWLISAPTAHLVGLRAPLDLTRGGGGCCCYCLGDVEGSGQDGGLQRGRTRRRALPWLHGGKLHPSLTTPFPSGSRTVPNSSRSVVLLCRPSLPRSCRLSSSGSRPPSRHSPMPRSRR